ncbi:hypothetical protein KC901_01035 [Patescibacteria group bacterium]|nr:hypothetical protein [Patescibacteria group bacterium]
MQTRALQDFGLRRQHQLPDNTRIKVWSNQLLDNAVSILFETGEEFQLGIQENNEVIWFFQDVDFYRHENDDFMLQITFPHGKIKYVCSPETNYIHENFVWEKIEIVNNNFVSQKPLPKKNFQTRSSARR